MIKDLKDKEVVQGHFLVREKQILKDKKGNAYFNLYLSDRTGRLNARMWDRIDELNHHFEEGDFIWAKGHVQLFQSRLQLIVHDLRRADDAEVNLEDFLLKSVRPIDEMWQELLGFVSSLKNVHIKKLLELTFSDDQLSLQLRRSPAAKSIHHAYLGGLLEHILSICRLMEGFATHYPKLRRDLLIFGAIYHDLGKVRELEVGRGIKYSDEGKLVGHMMIACEMIDRFSSQIEGFPQKLKWVLQHIILGHHGRLEYGSPKLPMFPEAILVAQVDEIDSQMQRILQTMQDELAAGEDWTLFQAKDNRYYYLPVLRGEFD